MLFEVRQFRILILQLSDKRERLTCYGSGWCSTIARTTLVKVAVKKKKGYLTPFVGREEKATSSLVL